MTLNSAIADLLRSLLKLGDDVRQKPHPYLADLPESSLTIWEDQLTHQTQGLDSVQVQHKDSISLFLVETWTFWPLSFKHPTYSWSEFGWGGKRSCEGLKENLAASSLGLCKDQLTPKVQRRGEEGRGGPGRGGEESTFSEQPSTSGNWLCLL